jgi:hypothetical protein
MVLENVIFTISKYDILSTGHDGGHRYISTSVIFNGQQRDLTIFFFGKDDENTLMKDNPITVTGQLIDERGQNLILNEAVIC